MGLNYILQTCPTYSYHIPEGIHLWPSKYIYRPMHLKEKHMWPSMGLDHILQTCPTDPYT